MLMLQTDVAFEEVLPPTMTVQEWRAFGKAITIIEKAFETEQGVTS